MKLKVWNKEWEFERVRDESRETKIERDTSRDGSAVYGSRSPRRLGFRQCHDEFKTSQLLSSSLHSRRLELQRRYCYGGLSFSLSLSSAMIFHFWLFSFLFSSTSSPIRVLNYLVLVFFFWWFGLICCWIILVILLEMTELLFCCCYLDWFGLICCWYYFWLFSFGLICCWDYFGLNFCWRGQKLYLSGPIEFIYMLLLLLFLGL